MPDTNDDPLKGGTNRFLRKLRRWHGWPSSQRRPPRGSPWQRWLGCHFQRWQRLPVSCRKPTLVLAHPGAWVQRWHERWLVSALWLRPQIHLAIQPLLEKTVLHNTNVRPLLDQSPRLQLPLLAPSPGMRTVSSSFPAGRLDIHRLSSEHRAQESAERVTMAYERTPELRKTTLLPQLSLVFQRAWAENGGWSKPRRAELVTNETTLLLARVVRRTQRLEERIVKPALVTSSPHPKFEATQRPLGPAVLETAGVEATAGVRGRGTQAVTPTPPLNVEALAEQVLQRIDRRVTAWRERTGRQ